MAVLSPLFLGLLVAFLEFEVSAAVDCSQVGGICIPITENAKCVRAKGLCSPSEICCKACSSIPTSPCAVEGGFCVKKPSRCPSGNIISGCTGKKCKLCCMRVSPPPPSCQSYTGVYGTYGEVIMPDNGIIPYQDNLDCTWIIEVPYGYWISIYLYNFDLEGCCANCGWDYLQFWDASSYMQWPGQTLCGTMDMIQNTFVATTNIMQVNFHSDISLGKTGFYFTWSAIAQPSCPAYSSFYGYYGEVYMPDNGIYPYQNNQYCEWFIEAPYGYVITIYITSLELEGPSSYCPYDYLQFFDASGYSIWQSEKLCGTIGEIQTSFYTSTNMILAVFNSDGSATYNGFTFTWSAEAISCQPYTSVYSDYGEVYMPVNGIGPYQNNQDCELFIEVPYGYLITIHITSIELEGPSYYCPYDYLQFFDASGYTSWQSQKLCGTIGEIQTSFYTPTNMILAVFHSDSYVTYNGFTFTWYAEATQPSTGSCPLYSVLYSDSGVVNMPENGIGPYMINQDCEWIIEVTYGFGIYIEIISLEIESDWSSSCPYDYLQFFDASGNNLWQSQKLCGNMEGIQTLLYAPTNVILVVFHSDYMVQYNGFTFTWYAGVLGTPALSSCALYTGYSGYYGTVYMPDTSYPPYQNNQYCEWYIEGPYYSGIEINIINLNLEGSPDACPYDYLQFFDASGYSGWQSPKLCGNINQIQPYIFAPTNMILAVFYSDGSVVGNGFTFSWSSSVSGWALKKKEMDLISMEKSPKEEKPN